MIAQILSKENMTQAYNQVRKNKGAAGIDGKSVDDLSVYLREHWPSIMLSSHKRAMRDIVRCRTEAFGGRCYPCDDYRYSYHSCKNRHCPQCGNDDATRNSSMAC